VYKRGGIWWIQFFVDGKRYFESSGSQFRADAETLLRKRLDQPIDRKPTVNDILDRLIEDYEIRKRDTYKVASHLKHVRERLGKLKAVDINEDVIHRYQKFRLQSVSHGTVNRECQMLGQALNKLAYPKIISRPIRIRKLTENPPRKDFFEPQEVQQILAYLPDYLKDYVLFAWLSGWRKGEVSKLTFDDIQGNEIRLWHDQSKNGEPRILTLTGELLSLIRKRQSERVEGCPYVFHRRGEFIRDFRKSWRNACQKAGIPVRNPQLGIQEGKIFHALRRSTARDRIRAGVHERVVMSVNGWKTRSVFDRYNITDTKDIQDALERTEAYRKRQLSTP
jgi:integrase